jgi:hypothetical protein
MELIELPKAEPEPGADLVYRLLPVKAGHSRDD